MAALGPFDRPLHRTAPPFAAAPRLGTDPKSGAACLLNPVVVLTQARRPKHGPSEGLVGSKTVPPRVKAGFGLRSGARPSAGQPFSGPATQAPRSTEMVGPGPPLTTVVTTPHPSARPCRRWLRRPEPPAKQESTGPPRHGASPSLARFERPVTLFVAPACLKTVGPCAASRPPMKVRLQGVGGPASVNARPSPSPDRSARLSVGPSRPPPRHGWPVPKLGLPPVGGQVD